MALFYRITAFGKPRGPWRATKRLARFDAVEMQLGSFDEEGRFFLDAIAGLEWIHEDQLKLRA